ncbi:MAG: phosphoglycerate dehydrogenase [Gammaproteobacteria bacterium]
MHHILIADKLAEEGINFLNDQPGIHTHIQTGMNEDELCDMIGDYDALLVRSDTKVTEKVLRSASKLKVVGRAGIGVDNVDIAAATERGIIVMNTPDANATTTAELAIAHLLSLSRHLPSADRSVRGGKWERSKLVGLEVAHKTLAILGFGTIGRIVANRAQGLGMQVIGYDPFVTPEVFESYNVTPVDLDELVARADYLTLHCPLIDKTRGIIGRDELARMKKGAMLINCARGGLVDEAALYDALKNKNLAGAALDVYENEPPADSPLLELDNIVFTPHLGASTVEAQVAVSVEIARQAVTYLTTGEAVNALNLPRMSADQLQKAEQFMKLANILGKVLSNLVPEPVEHLEVALFGRAAEVEARPVSVEALVGLLAGKVSTPVNRVNAEKIAKRQGIALIESKTEEVQDFVSMIKVTGHYGTESTTLSGVLLGGRHPRLIQVDQFEVEVVPEGTLVITRHDDKPGMISAISGVLGQSGINIVRMEVGASDTEQHAMAVISISEPLSDELLAKLYDVPSVHQATQIIL